MNNFSNATTGAFDTRGPNHNPSTPYRVSVYTRVECVNLIEGLAADGVELRLKIENSETHLTISRSQLVKYIKSCRWFDCYSEMSVEVFLTNTSNEYVGTVRFSNEGWG